MKINWKDREQYLKYHRDFNKVWYEKNKEKRRAQIKDYAQTHKADSVRRTQKYVAKNKEKVYSYGRQYNLTPSGAYRVYKSVAAKKGNEFVLTLEDFSRIVINPCQYCGEDSKRIGIDRINNALGYTKENSAPCCQVCNYMKKNHSVDDFLSHIKKIYEYNGK